MNTILKKVKHIFVEKKPNFVYRLQYNIKDYNDILNLWKNYMKSKKVICPFEYETMLKNIFSFHKMDIDHVIAIQSYNLTNCLLMCKINKEYINLIIPKIPFHENDISIIATFT